MSDKANNAEQNKELIEATLKGSMDSQHEALPAEHTSPLAQNVVQRNNTAGDVAADKAAKPNVGTGATNPRATQQGPAAPAMEHEEPSDAPTQPVDEERNEEEKSNGSSGNKEEAEFQVPIEHATMMANTIIGMANNTLFEVGAGYFVTISKHQEFYEFDELIQVVDEQNAKNIKRIKLDEEDKALLRPLLIQVLRKKAKVLTPEQQLLGVAISIIIKKAKVVMEIRSENKMLEQRLLEIIRQQRGGPLANEEEEEEEEEQEDNNGGGKDAPARQERAATSGPSEKSGKGYTEYEEIPEKPAA